MLNTNRSEYTELGSDVPKIWVKPAAAAALILLISLGVVAALYASPVANVNAPAMKSHWSTKRAVDDEKQPEYTQQLAAVSHATQGQDAANSNGIHVAQTWATCRNDGVGCAKHDQCCGVCTGTSPQRWSCKRAGDYPPQQTFNPISRGTFIIVAFHSKKAIDAPNKAEGTQLTQYTVHGLDNQKWELIPYDGWNLVRGVQSDLYWDVIDDSNARGAAIILYRRNNQWNQQFGFKNVGGVYTIMARSSGKLVEVEDSHTHNGAWVQQWSPHDKYNARFELRRQ